MPLGRGRYLVGVGGRGQPITDRVRLRGLWPLRANRLRRLRTRPERYRQAETDN